MATAQWLNCIGRDLLDRLGRAGLIERDNGADLSTLEEFAAECLKLRRHEVKRSTLAVLE